MQKNCFFGHEYDPFLGRDITVSYPIGANVSGTAVIRIHTQDGFVIAADGLRRNIRGLEITDSQQKIFRIEQRGGIVAYALTGVTFIQEDAQTTFSVSDAIAKITNGLLIDHFTTAERYVRKFGKSAIDSLRKAQKNGQIKQFQDFGKQGLIVKILFAGYHQKQPFMADITLLHNKQKLQPPQLEFKEYLPDMTDMKLAGSEIVFNGLLHTDNPDLVRFRSGGFIKFRNKQSLSESDVIELAHNYIAACADAAGRKLDPDCLGIGGHTHIAIIKPDGFRWIIPPA